MRAGDRGAAGQQGVRYPPHRLRDGIHRALFGAAAALGPHLQTLVLRAFFELKYRRSNPWFYEATPYQQLKSGCVLGQLPEPCYRRVLEIGCGEGVFSRQLLTERRAIELLGVDISERAVVRARARCADCPGARFHAGDIFYAPLSGNFNLVVVCEVLYYLGGSVAALGKLAVQALTAEGCVVLVHPWPQARELHALFAQGSGLRRLCEHIEEHPERPFCVTLLTP